MLTIWTYDWVPGGAHGPRGFVRDIRLRWACEEAGLDYEVRTVPFENRAADHFARQPFGQVPFLEDDGITIFESGAGLLHLGRKSEKLMPRDPAGEADALQWTMAALNSVEMVSVPWWFIGLSKDRDNPLTGWLLKRFEHLEAVLHAREWLAAGRFSIADILMADVLRSALAAGVPGSFPALQAYVQRACSRSAFKKAHSDQLAHFAAGDKNRGTTP